MFWATNKQKQNHYFLQQINLGRIKRTHEGSLGSPINKAI